MVISGGTEEVAGGEAAVGAVVPPQDTVYACVPVCFASCVLCFVLFCFAFKYVCVCITRLCIRDF